MLISFFVNVKSCRFAFIKQTLKSRDMDNPQSEISTIVDYSYILPFVGDIDVISDKAVGTLINGALKDINSLMDTCEYQYCLLKRNDRDFYLNFVFDVPCSIDNRIEAEETAEAEAKDAVNFCMSNLISILETE